MWFMAALAIARDRVGVNPRIGSTVAGPDAASTLSGVTLEGVSFRELVS